jgi:hypothetical protein
LNSGDLITIEPSSADCILPPAARQYDYAPDE